MRRHIDEKTLAVIEAVLSRESRVEIVPTKNGIRVKELRPVEITIDASDAFVGKKH